MFSNVIWIERHGDFAFSKATGAVDMKVWKDCQLEKAGVTLV